jgi:GNAT superfamily N-acetyltransferase/RimJ/RimL family protein N-acetyltransferase
VRFEQYDPKTDEQRLRAVHEMFVAAQPADDPNVPPPSFGLFRGWLCYGFGGEPQQCWLVTADSGAPLGGYVLQLPRHENRQNAFLETLVAAGSRQRGIGTTLLAHAARQAELADRVLLMGGARVGAPGDAFARAIGATAGLREARRILDVGPALHAKLPGLRGGAEAHAGGYSLLQWTGPTPDDQVDGACQLYTAMQDAPHDAAFEPMIWDAARLRASEQRLVVQGTRDYSVAASHDQTGEMAALTQVTIDPAGEPGWAYQQITAVTRAHRGHRLGMLLKTVMLQWLATAEPQIRHITTFNAVPNEHMIAVNEALGHRVSDYFQSYEMPVETALKLPVSG